MRLLLVIVALTTIGCDRITKQIATTTIAGAPMRSLLADTVRLEYAENAGGFLSVGAGWPRVVRTLIFTAATGVVLIVFIVYVARRRGSVWAAAGLTLFVAGASSNWIDRALRGNVVDFLNVGVGSVRTGVFNVADVAIMIGCAMFVLSHAFEVSE